MYEATKTPNDQSKLEKKGNTLAEFNTHYRAMVFQSLVLA